MQTLGRRGGRWSSRTSLYYQRNSVYKRFVMRFPRPPNSEFEPEAVNENNKVLFSELASDDSTVQGDWILVPFFHFPVLLVASTRRRSSDQRVVIDDGVEGFKHVRVGPQPQSKQRPGYSIHRP